MAEVDAGIATASLDLNERFGPTIQGEGPSMGRRCAFIRLARCNLDCGEGEGATWACDTAYSWRWRGQYDDSRPTYRLDDEVHPTPIGELVDWVAGLDVRLCVVTGGEPLAQRARVAVLARLLGSQDIAVEVETNGTIAPGPAARYVAVFNVSPKLANSGVSFERRYVPGAIEALRDTGKARFKFVCADVSDLDEVAMLAALAELPADSVWIMPAGTDAATVRERLWLLAGHAIERGWNVTTRMHVELWGDKRGV